MGEANFLFYNGKISKTGKMLISPDNRSFKYGDGFFETLKMVDGKLLLADYHFERLFESLDILQFSKPVYFSPDYLKEQITVLAKKNVHSRMARIRITIFRGEGGLYEVSNHFPHYLIQSWELNPANNKLNENGLVLGMFSEARKVCDSFSPIKSNNYLPYVMAALWAKREKLNDAILLNPYNRVSDATIANVFIVKDGQIRTPALSEGCVNGVMRRHLLSSLRRENMPVSEDQLSIEEIMEASEIFLTNAIYGIRWVKGLGNSGYTNQLATYLHKNFVQSLM